jgi:diguanylate cyclase (GGDEF)-like protein/PAS domain S-box-containing protein
MSSGAIRPGQGSNAHERIGEILLRTDAVVFRWRNAPGWPVVFVSDNVRRWGLDPAALMRGEPLFAKLVHPADLARVAAEVERHCQQWDPCFRQEYRLRDGDGGWRWIEDHTWVERGTDGQVLSFNGVLVDVTERKLAELALEVAAGTIPSLLDSGSLDALVNAGLARIGQGMGADRAYLFEFHDDDESGSMLASQRYEWCAEGVSPQIDNPDLQGIPFSDIYPRWLGLLQADGAVRSRVADMPPMERALLEAQDIRSLLVVPVNLRGRLWGFLGFDAVRRDRSWTTADERVLRLTAAALAAAIEQDRMVEALRLGEERQRLALEAAEAGSWEWRPGRVSVWSHRHFQILGLDPEEIAPSFETWLASVHAEDRDWVAREVESARKASRPFTLEYRIRRPDESIRWVQSIGKPRRYEGGHEVGMVGILLDIDTRKQAEERLRLSAAVIDSTRDGVVVTGLDARIIAVNRAYCEITGYAESELLGENPRILQSGRHDDRFYAAMWGALVQNGHWQGEIWSRRKNGEVYPEWLTISAVSDEAGRVRHYVGVVTDVSRLKQTEAELARLAHYDPLTGLPNRLLAQSRLEHAVERCEYEDRRLALLMVDLDHFKTINDSLGHEIGDELLRAIGDRLRAAIAGTSTVARLGGDEFLLITEDVQGVRDAEVLAHTVLESLRAPFEIMPGQEMFVAASIGISLYPEDGLKAGDLVRSADAALFRAKELGRNTFHFFTASLVDAASERLDLELRLRQGLKRGEFLVHYQPILRCEDGGIEAVEALLRWQPPGESQVLPGRFIGLAEDTGLIGPLGDWVLETACRQVQRWRRMGAESLRLAVNLSQRQLQQPEFGDRVMRILADSGLDPDGLELEITESMLMEKASLVIGTLHTLRALGVRVSIDDFGTGYSSLAHLKRLPLDTLKIDRSFVADIPRHQGGAEIAAAIIALGHQLHLEVLAEGVETEEQLDFLREHGCDQFQGFLVSPAVSPEELAQRFLADSAPG